MESEKYFQSIFEVSPIGIELFDAEGRLQEVNPSCLAIFGVLDAAELKGISLFSSPDLSAERRSMLSQGKPVTYSVQYDFEKVRRQRFYQTSRSGTAYLDVTITPLVTHQEIDGYLVQVQDVTERKLVEDALRKSEESYRQLFEYAPSGIYEVDFVNARFTLVNPVICSYTGYTEEELLSMGPFDVLTEESQHYFLTRQEQINRGEPVTEKPEFCIRNKDGSLRWIQLNSDFKHEDGHVTGARVVAHDITDRRQAEEKIKTSLKEKEILLEEIHHRVKNSMQIITSLLGLQAERTGNEGIRQVLKDNQCRVYALSAVHETMYDSENLTDIDLKSYLTKLAGIVSRNCSSSRQIQFSVEADDVKLHIEQASPLGFAVNELLSNISKHAFPDRNDCAVAIRLKQLDEQQIELSVADNGIGLPSDIDWENTDTLGLQLVKSLVEDQLGGSVTMKSNHGTTYTIRFSIET